MSFTTQVLADAGRAAVIASAAIFVATSLARQLAHTHSRLLWAALWAPWLTPSLLVSYAYSALALPLGGGLALHSIALLLRAVPVAALVLLALPPPLSAEAAHCHRLGERRLFRRFLFRTRQAGPAPVIAGALVFLIAFTDFELASLWSVKTWPVLLFDAHAGGLAPRESLRLILFPLIIEIAALAAIAATMRTRATGLSWPSPNRRESLAARTWLLGAATAITVVPAVLVATRAVTGWPIVFAHFALGREVLTSVAFAIVAATAAAAIAHFTAHWSRPRALALLIPGSLGALTLSLLILALFQIPPLRTLYDTPAPLLLALTLLLLPIALPLRWLGDSSAHTPSIHLARLTDTPTARDLLWWLDGRTRVLCALIPFCLAYFDFTAGSLLAPIALPTIFPRLHNLAHYGQTAVLSAMMLTAFAAPALLLPLVITGARLLSRRK